MLARLAEFLIRRSYRAINAGDIEVTLRMLADDVCFVFPGTSSWSGEYRGKAEVSRFLRRVVAHGLTYVVHDVLFKGPPWNMLAVIVLSDHARDSAGRIAYSNRAVEYCHLRWGKLQRLEVFEDTERASAWDRVLAASRSTPA
jgi:ketosteroid isomerase-like protein